LNGTDALGATSQIVIVLSDLEQAFSRFAMVEIVGLGAELLRALSPISGRMYPLDPHDR